MAAPARTRRAAAADNGTPPAGDLELLKAEVATEIQARDDLPEGAVTVPLHDRAGEVVAEFVVLHPDDWPSSANEDVNSQRYFSWALKVMATSADVERWRTIDPRNREVVGFINEWQARSGNLDPGKGLS